MRIRAAQLIYSRVEPAFSPLRKTGFQTVYRTESLTSVDIAEIESRVQCFQPREPGLVRLQFFVIRSGLVILTHTKEIRPNPQVVDRDSRDGAFIAHCLAIQRNEFQKVEFEPFTLFERYSFLDNAEEMIEVYGQATGVAPLAEIDVDRKDGTPRTSWAAPQLQKLLALALQAEELRNKGSSVLLVGTPDHIEEALRAAFSLLPASKRLACLFDTYIERCPPPQGQYWAVGARLRQGGSSFIEVNAEERRVVSAINSRSNLPDLYTAWLNDAFTSASADTIMEQADTIQQLSNAFSSRSVLDVNKLDLVACRAFMTIHHDLVSQNVKNATSKELGNAIAPNFSKFLERILDLPELLGIAASQSFERNKLGDWLIEWFTQERPILPDADWRNIGSFARKLNNMRLLHLAATLSRSIDVQSRDEALSQMDEYTFQLALEQLLNPISPEQYVSQKHLASLLSAVRSADMSDLQFTQLVQAIIEHEGANELQPLASRVLTVGTDALPQLEKVAKRHANIAPDFESAIKRRRIELGPAPRRFGLFS